MTNPKFATVAVLADSHRPTLPVARIAVPLRSTSEVALTATAPFEPAPPAPSTTQPSRTIPPSVAVLAK